MALIKCTECGHEISSSAKCCPNCGCKTVFQKRNEQQWTEWGIYAFAGAISLIGALLWITAAFEMAYADLAWWNIFAVFGYTAMEQIYFGTSLRYIFGLGMIVAGVIIEVRQKRKHQSTPTGKRSGFSRGIPQKGRDRTGNDPMDRRFY